MAHAEAGREIPAGDVNVRARRGDLLGDARQRRLAVDEQLRTDAGDGRERAAAGPASGGRVEGGRLPVRCKPAAMVRADRRLDPVADRAIDLVQQRLDLNAPVAAPARTGRAADR
jgi:hypothetical protein